MEIKINTEKALEEANKEVGTLVETSRIVVNSQPTLIKANDQKGILKEIKKSVQEKKDKIIKPLNEALKNTRSLFAPVEEKITTIKTYLDGQILTYNNKLQEELEKREKEALKKIEKGEDIEDATKLLEKTQEIKSNIKNVRKIPTLRITNVDKIPRKFMIPDTVTIRKALLAGAKIEGAELYDKEISTY